MKENTCTGKTIPTTIRVPEKLLMEIKNLAAEIGDSQNGVMMHLLYWGMRVYKSDIEARDKA